MSLKYFAITIASCVLATVAANDLSHKFDVPLHIVGTNNSATKHLQPWRIRYQPVDLGVDYLDDEVPMKIRLALGNASISNDPTKNQISHADGLLKLRNAIARLYSRLIGHKLNAEKNVLISVGATEAVNAAFSGHTSPGDEWVIIDPAYTMYLPMIQMARGVPRFTTLKLRKHSGQINGDDWVLDKKEMESLFNEKTKGILLNNPLNPIGKVYTLDELLFIASLAKKYNTIVISDEAHEWITHRPHIRIASLPGMFERTITVGSSSKSFSVSGWRVGWAYGPEKLIDNVKTVHANTLYCAPTPQQEALAFLFNEEIRNFGSPNSYFASHRRDVKLHQDMMLEAFNESGMIPVIPDGGFCLLANWTSIRDKVDSKVNSSMDFVKWLIENVGVLGLPMSAFYGEENRHMGEDFVRYCFHKKHDTLLEAARRLRKLKSLRKY